MRYRISAMIIAVMALAGLAAPAAFADSTVLSLPGSCTPGKTYDISSHVMANANTSVGIDYNGTGNPITVHNPPGDTSFICAAAPNTYLFRNAFGHCFRMQDASNNFAVIETGDCQNDNTNYRFLAFPVGNGRYQFQNVHFGRWLGTADCPPINGSRVLGVPNAPGNCLTWVIMSH